MSGGGGGGGERTEQATPKRRKKARHDGQIGNTPELGAWLGMLAATFVLPHVFSSLYDAATTCLVRVGAVIRAPDVGRAMSAASSAFGDALVAALPLALLTAFVGVLGVAGQGALWFAPGLLKPKFSRLNPLSGLKRMFGKHGWWTLVKSLIKTLALALVVYLSIRNLVPTVMGSGSLTLAGLLSVSIDMTLNVLRYAAVAGLLMAVADLVVTRKRNSKHLKMTRQEVKDEAKESEGDPMVRHHRRARAMAMRRNRMMADIPTADVVVVNPTHVAVALKYDPQKGAPRVVAKGADHIAAKMRQIAEENRVPMVSDVPLARTLYKACDVGQEIPADLYKAVATVLAFIMTLKRRGSASGVHTVRTLTPTR